MAIKGLSSQESERLRASILQRESSGNYQAVNQFGYIGGYQFGAPALEDLGLIKKGASKGGNAALDNPANWNDPPGSKQAFLNNTSLQDQSFQRLANNNISILEKKGVITGDTPSGDVAGYAATSHLLGPGGAIKLSKGVVGQDANGTKATEYFGLGKSAVTGSATAPSRPGAATPSGAPRTITPNTGTPQASGPLKETGIADSVEIPLTNSQEDDIPLPIPNPLSLYVSFNSIFTLSCLDNAKVNFPDSTYKVSNDQLGYIILRAGGSQPDNRIRTAYTNSDYNPQGKFEYFIDNISIDTIMSHNKQSKGSNATSITFEVLEPYSMGIFLQSCQLAAKEAGHENYLEAPFLLTVEFVGFDDNGNSGTIQNTTRHIPLKFSNIVMDVDVSGCKYKVEAYPWNEIVLTDLHNLVKTDIGIAGATVQEILQNGKQSLQYALNHRLQTMAATEKTKTTPDEIVIIFPKELVTESSNNDSVEDESTNQATIDTSQSFTQQGVNSKLTINRSENLLLTQEEGDLNEIGQSTMGFDLNTGGQSPLLDDNFVLDEATGRYVRGRITFDPKSRMFMFAQGTSIINAITEVLLMSEYCKRSANSNKTDEVGMKQWFRIDTQVFNMDSAEGNQADGRPPRLLVYKVVPYKVHSMRFSAPSSSPEGYEQLKKQAVKHYDYIYTGKNTEILNFNINLQTGFSTTVYADRNQTNKDVANPQHVGQAGKSTTSTTTDNEDQNEGNENGVGQITTGRKESRSKNSGGGPNDDDRSLVAKQFQEALLNSPADLLTADLQIMGDPYFIADSGMGNFSNTGTTKKINLTNTGAIDYQSGEVDILLNFRTPTDINPITGIADFGKTEIVNGFSGLYQVIRVINNFQNGRFSQNLELVRRLKQNPLVGVESTAEDQEGDGAESLEGGSATVDPNDPGTAQPMETTSTSGDSRDIVTNANPDERVNNDWWA